MSTNNHPLEPATGKSHDRRAETSPINGAKSTGPKTEDGKAKSAANSLKHGFYSRDILLATESKEEYNHLIDWFLAAYEPVGPEQHDLVMDMAHARWRVRRVERHEKALMHLEMARALQKAEDEFVTLEADTLEALAMQRLSDSKTLENIHRMAQRFERTYHRSRQALLSMRGSLPLPDPPAYTPPAPKTQTEPDPQPTSDPEPRVEQPAAEPVRNEPTPAEQSDSKPWGTLLAVVLLATSLLRLPLPAGAAPVRHALDCPQSTR